MKKILSTLLALSACIAVHAAAVSYSAFLSKSGVEHAGDGLRIHKDGQKYWLEFPDSLMGRRVILSSFMRSSSGWTTCGKDVSSKEVFVISKTDSLLILSSPLVKTEASVLAPVRYVFPIKYRSADSTSVVVDASKLFSVSNKDVVNPKGIQIDANAMVYKATPQDEFTVFKELVAYPSSVGVVRNVTFKAAPAYDLGKGMLQVIDEELFRLEGDVATVLTVVPDTPFEPRVADGRIGTLNSPRQVFSAERGIETQEVINRWDISEGKHIVVYVDTLFSQSQFDAVSRGLLAWNEAFEAAGLGSPVEVRPFERDSCFSAENPLVSKVFADLHSSSQLPSLSVLSDRSVGRVLSCSITIPAGMRSAMRQEGLLKIADVDPRWREYDTPEDAFCEALSARVMQAFAKALGLSANAAGSYAYSPAQLRDPQFTREHGITASVTDDVLFNTLARPSDVAKGVKTIVDKPGQYDFMAVEWIYSDAGTKSDRELADSILASKAGNPAFLYLPAMKDSPDPRVCSGDLGNDPFEEYATAMSKLKFIAAGIPEWLEATVPQNTGFRSMLAEQMLLRHIDEHRKLGRLVGGLYIHDLSSGSKYEPVPGKIQKKAMVTAFRGLSQLDYLDSNKALLEFSGAFNGFSPLMRVNSLNQTGIITRLKWAAAAEKLGVSTYRLEDLLSDITDEVTVNLRKGSVPEGEDFLMGVWISMGLMKNVPVYARNYSDYMHKTASLAAVSDEVSVSVPTPFPKSLYASTLENACAKEMERLYGILLKCRDAARSDYAKDRIGYSISTIEGALKK